MVLARPHDPFSPHSVPPAEEQGPEQPPVDGRQEDAEEQKPPADPAPAKRGLRRKTPAAPKTSRRARRAPDGSTDVDSEIADLLGDGR